MDIKGKLEQIAKLESDLNEYFGGMIYEVIRDMTNYYWTVSGEHTETNESGFEQPFTRASDVGWSENSPMKQEFREHTYAKEVQSVVRRDDFTLVCIRTSTGDGCEDLIFDNTKEITEEELVHEDSHNCW